MDEAKKIVGGMSLEELAGMVSGKNFWSLKGVERLGVPEVLVSDGPNGLRKQTVTGGHGSDQLGVNKSIEAVCLPPGCLAAASFDRNLMREYGEKLGEECQAEDISVILGPAMNIKRTPVGGRNFEYFSEDPHLTGELATAYVLGVQSRGVGACPKHFVANNQEHERMTISVEVGERALREIYLAGFEAVTKKARPWTMMSGYNRVNGEYVGESKRLLTDILRGEWGFDGYVISDWGAVDNRVAGLMAGMDLEMPPTGKYATDKQVVEAVQKKKLNKQVLATSVERMVEKILQFSNSRQVCKFDRGEHHDFATKVARESAILLKNDRGLLPLKKTEQIALIGGFAKNPRYQGNGSSRINAHKVTNAVDATVKMENIVYMPGFSADDDGRNRARMDVAVVAAKAAKVAVIFAGLPEIDESEGYDRTHMRLPAVQNELIAEICKVQKNVVVVLHNGGPVEMPWADDVTAVLEMYLGGEGVGEATVDILFGDTCPSGKLPETFPLRYEDNPSYLTAPGARGKIEYQEGVFVGYRYYDKRDMGVLFPFGHGLSYTQFEYGGMRISLEEMTDVDRLLVEVDVKNVGGRSGKEVVQLYVGDRTGRSLPRAPLELKEFDKIELMQGETKTLSFELTRRDFAYYDEAIEDWAVSVGEYEIAAGSSSRDIRLTKRVLMKPKNALSFLVTRNTRIGELLEHPETAKILQKVLDGAIANATKGAKNLAEARVKERVIEAFMTEAPLRSLRSFYGFDQEELDAAVSYFNNKLGNETGMGNMKVLWVLREKLMGMLVR